MILSRLMSFETILLGCDKIWVLLGVTDCAQKYLNGGFYFAFGELNSYKYRTAFRKHFLYFAIITIDARSFEFWCQPGPCGIPENTGIPGLNSNTATGIFENKIPVFFGIMV